MLAQGSQTRQHASKTTDLRHPEIHSIVHKKWAEKKYTMISEKLVFSHLFEALKCNFIYKLSIRFNAKFRLPCLSKTVSAMESRKIKLYKNWHISRHFLWYFVASHERRANIGKVHRPETLRTSQMLIRRPARCPCGFRNQARLSPLPSSHPRAIATPVLPRTACLMWP